MAKTPSKAAKVVKVVVKGAGKVVDAVRDELDDAAMRKAAKYVNRSHPDADKSASEQNQ